MCDVFRISVKYTGDKPEEFFITNAGELRAMCRELELLEPPIGGPYAKAMPIEDNCCLCPFDLVPVFGELAVRTVGCMGDLKISGREGP